MSDTSPEEPVVHGKHFDESAKDLPLDDIVLDDIDFSKAGVDAIMDERDAFKDALQRLQADFENYRKRMLKQQSEATERANEGFAQKLLPVLDTIALAQSHEPSGTLEQVSIALLDVLKREGLEPIEAVGRPFDPTQHEAVAHEEGEGGPVVSEDMRTGYRWKGRVIRPTMVKVIG